MQISVGDGTKLPSAGKVRVGRDFQERACAAIGVESQPLQAFFLGDEVIVARRENHV